MTERDPLDLLSRVANQPERPSSEFRDRLLDDLLTDLTDLTDDRRPDVGRVITFEETPMEAPKKKWLLPIAAAAAVALVVGAVVVATRGDDDTITTATTPANTSPTTDPPVTTLEPAPTLPLPADRPPAPTLTEQTALALIEAAGGTEGLTVAQITETTSWDRVTFDPLNPDRVLLGELDITVPDALTAPQLWHTDGDEPTLEPIPDAEPGASHGGQFQRDGTMLLDPGFGGRVMPVLDNGGNQLARIPFGGGQVFPGLVLATEGDRGIALLTNQSGPPCPYVAVELSEPASRTQVDQNSNAFMRVSIPEPGIAVAFPYFPDAEGCDPTTSTVARAWDLDTFEPLPDHPFDGMEIANGAISDNGLRGIVFAPDGLVSVIDMTTGDTTVELATIDGAPAASGLALNQNGTIAAVAAEDGQVQVFHVDSGQLLLTLDGDSRPATNLTPTTSSFAYDASRVALLDAATGAWTIVSLDPIDWITAACANGFTLTDSDREQNGIDPSVDC